MDKPKPRFTTFRRMEGHYDWLHPGDTQAQYMFQWAPGEELDLRRSFTVPIEYDWDARPYNFTAPELARNLVDHYREHYIYTGQLAKAEALVEYLEGREDADELARLVYDVELASHELVRWMHKLRLSIEALEDFRARQE